MREANLPKFFERSLPEHSVQTILIRTAIALITIISSNAFAVPNPQTVPPLPKSGLCDYPGADLDSTGLRKWMSGGVTPEVKDTSGVTGAPEGGTTPGGASTDKVDPDGGVTVTVSGVTTKCGGNTGPCRSDSETAPQTLETEYETEYGIVLRGPGGNPFSFVTPPAGGCPKVPLQASPPKCDDDTDCAILGAGYTCNSCMCIPPGGPGAPGGAGGAGGPGGPTGGETGTGNNSPHTAAALFSPSQGNNSSSGTLTPLSDLLDTPEDIYYEPNGAYSYYQGLLIKADGEMILFKGDGTRQLYEPVKVTSGELPRHRLREIIDQGDNRAIYTYGPSGEVDSITEKSTFTKFQITNSPTGQKTVVRRTYICPDESCATKTHLPELDETRTYSSGGALLTHEVEESSYVRTPTTGGLHDINVVPTSRLKFNYQYDQSGLLISISVERPGEATVPLSTFSWNYQNNLYQLTASTSETGKLREYQYSYRRTGESKIQTRLPERKEEYLFDEDGLLREYTSRLTPLGRPTDGDGPSAPESMTFQTEYLHRLACPKPTKITNVQDGTYTEYSYDTKTGALLAIDSPAPNGERNILQYEVGHFLDANPIHRILLNGEAIATFKRTSEARDNSWDPGFKVRRETIFSRPVTLATGKKEQYQTTTHFNPDLTVDRSIAENGSITHFDYSLRGLITTISFGPNNGSDEIDSQSPLYTEIRYIRSHPLEAITSTEYGPVGSAVVSNELLDPIGRTVEEFSSPGTGRAEMKSKFYYGPFGHLAVVLDKNRDHNNNTPEDFNGNATGRTWIRTDYVSHDDGRPHYTLKDIAPVYAGADWTNIGPNNFARTAYEYDPITGYLKKVTNDMHELIFITDGNGQIARVIKDGLPVEKHYYTPTQERTLTLTGLDSSGNPTFAETVKNYSPQKGGALHLIQYADGKTYEPIYDREGNLTQEIIKHNGMLHSRVKHYFDELGRELGKEVYGTSDEGIQSGSILYNELSKPEIIWTRDGKESHFTYNAIGAVTHIQSPLHALSFEYVPNFPDRVKRTSKSTGQQQNFTTEYVHDDLGRVVETRFLGKNGAHTPLTNLERHDSLGRTTWSQRADGKDSEVSISMSGVTNWVRYPGSQTRHQHTLSSFDATTKQLTTVTLNPSGQAKIAAVDHFGPKFILDPARGLTLYNRNAIGQITTVVDGAGRNIAFDRDTLGRIYKTSITHGAKSVTTEQFRNVTFDQIDRIVRTVSDGTTTESSTIQYSFDEHHQLAKEEIILPDGITRFTEYGRRTPREGRYYPGRIYSISNDNNAIWSYNYDELGRVSGVELSGNVPTDIPNNVLELGYDGSIPQSISLPNGVSTDVFYNEYGVLQSVISSDGSGQVFDGTVYERDSLQFIERIRSLGTTGEQCAVRDDALRITEYHTGLTAGAQCAASNATASETFSYSGDSMVMTSATANGTTNAISTDPLTGRPTQVGPVQLQYDSSGFRTSDKRQYEWDASGKLTGVKDQYGNPLKTYQYDPLGRLVGMFGPSSNKILRNVGTTPFAVENGGNGNIDEWSVYAPIRHQERVARFTEVNGKTNAAYFTHSQYNVSTATDEAGAVLARYSFDLAGKPTVVGRGGKKKDDPAAVTEQLFHSMPLDLDSGLYYANARWYDPKTRSFLSPDPIAGNHRGTNEYGYSNFNTLNYWDPWGLQGEFGFDVVGFFSDLFGLGDSNERVNQVMDNAIERKALDFDRRNRVGLPDEWARREGKIIKDWTQIEASGGAQRIIFDDTLRDVSTIVASTYTLTGTPQPVQNGYNMYHAYQRDDWETFWTEGAYFSLFFLTEGAGGYGRGTSFRPTSGLLGSRSLARCLSCEEEAFLIFSRGGPAPRRALFNPSGEVPARRFAPPIAWRGAKDETFQTLYRVMSRQEYQKMVNTGRVQLSWSGMTHAGTELGSYTGRPGVIVKFRTQAENVRRSSEKGWVQVRHPCDNLSKLEQKLNRPALMEPHAVDIEIVGEVRKRGKR
ncbi:MAG: hypothetical protein KDD70_08410 [Bdellovibrionales bacterium]|nr:hypothetical protein [Bdellovibrionales bacterium]